jgi:hypothetical protein
VKKTCDAKRALGLYILYIDLSTRRNISQTSVNEAIIGTNPFPRMTAPNLLNILWQNLETELTQRRVSLPSFEIGNISLVTYNVSFEPHICAPTAVKV